MTVQSGPGAAGPEPGPAALRGADHGIRGAAGDDRRLRSLIEEHGPALLAFATRATGDRQLAEDVVQETLFRAWLHPEALGREDSAPRSWLMTVARRVIWGHWRSQRRRLAVEDRAGSDTAGDHRDHFQQVADRDLLNRAVARLRPDHRAVLDATVWRQLPVSEAARELGIPVGTVKSRTYYALRSLRSILDEMDHSL
jgi:RNA polymerase sigma-70 factor (ECF subfamily)